MNSSGALSLLMAQGMHDRVVDEPSDLDHKRPPYRDPIRPRADLLLCVVCFSRHSDTPFPADIPRPAAAGSRWSKKGVTHSCYLGQIGALK